MYRREQVDREQNDRGAIITTTATGKARVVDVDEWLYQASRVRAFTPAQSDYVPKHRAVS